MTKYKNIGGLGIRESRMANIAQLVKIGSKVACGSEKVWVQVLRNNYLKNKCILDHDSKSGNLST